MLYTPTPTPVSIGPPRTRGLLWVVLLIAAALALPGHAGAATGNGTMSLTFADTSNAAVGGACAELYTEDYADYVTSFCTTTTFPVSRNLPAGGYVVHETQPPTAFGKVFRKAADKTFTISTGLTSTVTMQHERGAKIVVSALRPDGQAAVGSCFSARPMGVGGVGQLEDEACTGYDASTTLYVGYGGTMVITQESGPDEYTLAPDVFVTTQLDGQYTATMQMTIGSGGIAVAQQDSAGNAVTGGCYRLWKSPTGGQETDRGSQCDGSDAEGTNGSVHFSNLQPGRYRLQEMSAPAGYRVTPGDLFAIVGTDTVTLTQSHVPLPALVALTTTQGGAPLAGSCWMVRTPDDEEGWIVDRCDADDGADDGSTHLGALEPGDYVLVHLQAPAGYDRIDPKIPFTVTDGDLTLTFELGGSRAPSMVEPPAVAGNPHVGGTLTGTTGTWTGTDPIALAPQWQRCAATCEDILGATGLTYQVAPLDIGSTLRLAVTATNPGGSLVAASDPVGPVELASPPVSTALPVVNGSIASGQTLTATTGSWYGAAPLDLTYRWQRCDPTGTACDDIAGATGQSYTLTHAEAGFRTRVAVTATNADGSATAFSVPRVTQRSTPPANDVRPTIYGSIATGSTLTARHGLWDGGGQPLTYAYRWQSCDTSGADCVDIPGATDEAYVLTGGDVGHRTRLAVTATNLDGSTTAFSDARATQRSAPPANDMKPTVEGSIATGATLTAKHGLWSGGEPMTYAYRWQSCDTAGRNCVDLPGATDDRYVLTRGDVGHRTRVAVTAANGDGSTTAFSDPRVTQRSTPPANDKRPTVDGSVVTGGVLTANHGLWTGGQPLDFDYRWQSCDTAGENCTDIPGATGDTYTLAHGDVGRRTRVAVTATNPDGTATAYSDARVTQRNAPPSSDKRPTVQGSVVTGGVLTVSRGSWAGAQPIAFEYRWQSCNTDGADCVDIPGATGDTYTLTHGDVGRRTRAAVIATNPDGTATAYSDARVTQRNAAPSADRKPSIQGTAARGSVLTAAAGTWVGAQPITFAYRWQRCSGGACTDIAGATAATYMPVDADLDATLRFVVTATNPDGTGTAASGETRKVF